MPPRTSPRRLLATLVFCVAMPLAAQDPLPQASPEDLAAAAAAMVRMEDADTALSLAAEGAALYQREVIKRDGYEYCSRAVALAERGEFRESVRSASKALHVALASGNEDLLAKAYRDFAIVFNYANQRERARQFAQLALQRRSEDPTQVVGPANKILGDVAAREGEHAEAIGHYEAALAGSSENFRPLVQASLVNVLIASGDTARARRELDAIPSPRDPALAAQLVRTQGNLLLAEGRIEEALATFTRLAADQAGRDDGYQRVWALEGMSRAEEALGRPDDAARSLDLALAGLDAVRARFRSEEFKSGMFADAQALFARAILLASDTGQAERAFVLSERSRARALLDAVADRATVSGTAVAAMDLPAIQQGLRDDERVVAFHALPDRLLAWTVGPDSLSMQRLPLGGDTMVRLVDAYRDGLVNGRPAAVVAGERIAVLLLAPLGLEPGQRLLIVPHGPLHYLPFQALRVDGQYLVERHPVAIAPSASIAVRLAAQANRAAPRLVAFGNPDVTPDLALPGSEREVERLVELFPQSEAFIRDQATRSRFERVAGQARVLHVAAHAQADLVDPLHSRILLANENGRENFLEARDVLGLDLSDVALVTLSACESGLGRVADGEEVLGFTRSFLTAGAASLVVSLWQVSDTATEMLMSTLYAELAAGTDLQVAMQRAQLAVMANPATAHPFYWAPFNLIGNWRLTLGG